MTGRPSAEPPVRARPSAAWDSTPPRRLLPGALVTVAVLALAPAVLSTVLRLFPPSDDGPALVASFVPYGLLGYVVALLCLVVALVRARRRWPLVVLALLTLLLASGHVGWMAPLFVADHRPVVGPSFELLTLNVYAGAADRQDVTAAAARADVVVLIETTPDFLYLLQTPAWQQSFPYAVGGSAQQTSDTAVFSRFPLSGTQSMGRTSFQQWVMTVQVPYRSPVRLIAAHPCNPFCPGAAFRTDHALLRATVQANQVYPLVVAGDLNATDDHAPMQQLRADGMRSGTDLVGAGWVPTYPANRRFPPLLPIDHVLVDDALTVTEQTAVSVAGSDHLGLLATIAGTR